MQRAAPVCSFYADVRAVSLNAVNRYNALSDFFPKYEMKPNPTCTAAWCVKQQKLKLGQIVQTNFMKKPEDDEPVVHEFDFGITIEDESVVEASERVVCHTRVCTVRCSAVRPCGVYHCSICSAWCRALCSASTVFRLLLSSSKRVLMHICYYAARCTSCSAPCVRFTLQFDTVAHTTTMCIQ